MSDYTTARRTASRQKPRNQQLDRLAIYDGRTLLGFVLNRSGSFEAFAGERSLGSFATIKSATDAISDRRSAS